MSTEFRLTDPRSPEALDLIAGSEAEIAALYPAEVNFAFSPEQLIEGGVRFFVIWRDGVPVGCGGVAPCPGYGELKRIYLVEAARGSGLSGALLSRLEEEARAMGLALMRLETGIHNHAAIRFYERCGYRRCALFGDYEENWSSVFMEKPLPVADRVAG